MLLPTLKQARSSRIVNIAAACSNDAEFASLVNEATELLMNRGDWPGTLVPMRVCVRQGCIVWPRQVQRVRRINNCNYPLKVGTIWYDFVDRNDYVNWAGQNFYAWDGSGAAYMGLAQSLRQQSLASQGRVPTYNDVPSDTPRYIRAYALCQADKGKTVTIYGLDGNGQPLQTRNSDGTFTDGVVITLNIPFGSTSVYVQRIDAVIKDETQKNVPLYAYDPISDTQLDLAIYEPTETNPSYAKDRLDLGRVGPITGCTCNNTVTVIALVKLAFIPVKNDNDYILIPSLMALKQAIQAIKYGEAGNEELYLSYLQNAIDTLNTVLDNEQPRDQTSVDSGFMGGVQVGLQQVV